MWRRTGLIAAILLTIFVGSSVAQTRIETYRCRKPTTGGRPTGFRWLTCSPDSNTVVFSTVSADSVGAVTVPTRDPYFVRVEAFNASGTGPRSVASDPQSPGVPGACNKPWKG